ncbi:MAG: glycosyltransferase family 2 protein [Anaerolineae bacterium]|nr:glycosyltransferase family 2 protein [Anaerolineae bacterium]
MSAAVSVVIVSWNVRDLLRSCLTSLAAQRDALSLQVIVVDSASGDGTAEMVAAEFPWVELVACPENIGFPAGNNLGFALATHPYLFLLNPDTEVAGDAIDTLVAFLEANRDVGVVGPQLLNADGSVQSSRRRFPTLATGFFESTWLEAVAPRRVLDDYTMRDRGDDQQSDVDWLMGAALMARREVVDQVGGLDPGYFMYSEELDWCRRIRDAGWRIVYVPEAQIVHHAGKSSEQAVTARHINFQRAKLRYFRKYHGRLAATLLRLFLLASYLAQIGLEGAKGIVGHKRALRWQRVASYWEVVQSGLPPADGKP